MVARRVLLVDWLGQGGIFQTSLAWRGALTRQGFEAVLLTRREGEQGGDVTVGSGLGKVASHAVVARAAAAFIHEHRPDVVIIQNYIIPPLEEPVYRAARECRTKLVTVVHDHRPHSRVSGMRVGLRRLLRQADTLLAHTHFVAQGVTTLTGRRDVEVLPLPVPVAMVALAPEAAVVGRHEDFTAVHFGVLTRRYKGMSLVRELAAKRPPGWKFVIMGVGAPTSAVNVTTIPGFIPTTQLVAAVHAADACLLPYRWATQSAAVVLAQALGTVPVATAVGGVPEQIEDGKTGFLLPPDAPVETWQRALLRMSSRDLIDEMGRRARDSAWERHRDFERRAHDCVKA